MIEEQEFLNDEPEELYDASDSKKVNNSRKAAVRKRQLRIDFVREMMRSQSGRLWVYDILNMGHFASPTHTPGDPYSTAFKEGERNLANKILFDINESSPEMYMQMLTEGKTEK